MTPSDPLFRVAPDFPDRRGDDARSQVGTIRSCDLLAHGKLVHIQHRGELYALRETRLGKLILTK